MKRTAKREPGNSTCSSSRDRVNDNSDQQRSVKREKLNQIRVDSAANDESTQGSQQDTVQRRVLRSKYIAVINKINDNRDELSGVDSEKFNTIFNEVENLHQQVQKPREQVADAEALLDIANTLVTSVQSQSNEGISMADFVSCLISEFGQSNRGRLASQENNQMSINWKEIGLAVSPFLSMCPGCCTMVGTMNTEVKQRKAAVHRKRAKPTETARPEEVSDTGAEKKSDTDKNMSTMFEILRKKKRVRLESLILNRMSFAQTVENMFALSFLVKDGRIEIAIDEKGSHIVAPRNAPAADSVVSGKVTYNHFVFRFDFKDWKLMVDAVPVGEELMPHRGRSNTSAVSQAEPPAFNSQGALRTTPIKKLSRNRGLVIRDETVVEDSPEVNDAAAKPISMLRCKRKLI